MTYFQHTKRDLAEARQEIGEAILALADDTSRKLNADTLDRTYVIEDLLARMVGLAHEAGAKTSLFEVGRVYHRHVPAYPIDAGPIIGEALAKAPAGDETQEIQTGVANYRAAGRAAVEPTIEPLVSAATLREVHNTTEFDGIKRHPFTAGHSGVSCSTMVLRNGFGEDCGLPFDNAVHDWMW